MPVYPEQLRGREAYCLAMPTSLSNIRSPRLTQDCAERRPRVPLDAPTLEVKAEIESVEFVTEALNEEEDVKTRPNPRKVGYPL